MKLHAEYRVTKFHYTESGDLIADNAELIAVSLCHDDCPDTFNEQTLRLSESVIDDGWSRPKEETDEAPRPAPVDRRPDPSRRLH